MKTNFLLYILLLFYCIDLQGQSIQNVEATQHDKTIVVTYDLTGLKSGQTATISLFCSEDGGNNWGTKLHYVTGDVGQSISAGYGKQIVWQVLDERERLTGSNISFEVRAMLSNSHKNTQLTLNESDSISFIDTISNIDIEMVFVKGGSFTMGCTDEQENDCDDSEKPAHEVTLSDFHIGKYEVTQKQWRTVMGDDPQELYFKDCDNCPVENVSWFEIQEFIKKLNQKTGKNYRLPTEAEWEFAARGGNKSKGYKYSGSNKIDEIAWYENNSQNRTQSVAKKKPNELGLYDMSGNVWEWCSDWIRLYSTENQVNPQGATSGTIRVLRGGGWGNPAEICSVCTRNGSNPDNRGIRSGFRLATSSLANFNIEMVFVKGGSFTMGCTDEQENDCKSNEKPVHKVTLSDFYIGKFEVTVAQFKKFIDETNYSTDAEKGGVSYFWTGTEWEKIAGINWKHDAQGKVRPQSDYDHPVIHISWNDALEYSRWLSRKTGKYYRLPTEAEWEYAARGGTQSIGYKYAGSNNIGEIAWYDDNSSGKTHTVMKKKANEIGIFDMSGNAWEWCSDWFDSYSNSKQHDPQGPSIGAGHVLRGGGWGSNAKICRVSFRYYSSPVFSGNNFSFRLVESL
jgi:formylglycine-generating enzyme required for sulfatase activity